MKPKAYSLKSMVFLFALCALLYSPCANAAGLSSVHSLTTGTVSITNTQTHSSWVPVAVLFSFDEPVAATITITRQTGAASFQLATVELTDNQFAVWLPEAPYTFNLNDVLVVTSTASGGTIEIIRKADQ